MSDIFICYCKKDVRYAARIRNSLERNELTYSECGIDEKKDKTDFITDLQNSQIFLLVLSDQANASEKILEVIKQAVELKKTIITFVLTKKDINSGIEYHLGSFHRYNATEGSFLNHLNILTATIAQMLELPYHGYTYTSADKVAEKITAFFHTLIGNIIRGSVLIFLAVCLIVLIIEGSIDGYDAVLKPYNDRTLKSVRLATDELYYDDYYMSKDSQYYGIPTKEGNIEFYQTEDHLMVQSIVNPYQGGAVDIGFAHQDELAFVSSGLKVSFYNFISSDTLNTVDFEAYATEEDTDICGYLLDKSDDTNIIFVLGDENKVIRDVIKYNWKNNKVEDAVEINPTKYIGFSRDFRYIYGVDTDDMELYLLDASDYSKDMITGTNAYKLFYGNSDKKAPFFSPDGTYYIKWNGNSSDGYHFKIISMDTGECVYEKQFKQLQGCFIDTKNNLIVTHEGMIDKIKISTGKRIKRAKLLRLWEKKKDFNNSVLINCKYIMGTDFMLLFARNKINGYLNLYVLNCRNFSLMSENTAFSAGNIKYLGVRDNGFLVATVRDVTKRTNYDFFYTDIENGMLQFN